MKTAIISSDSSEKHFTGDGHPEQPKRVLSIKNKLIVSIEINIIERSVLVAL